MLALSINYHIKGQRYIHNTLVDAKNAKSAKRKIERKLKQKVCLDNVSIVGYY